jgi:hypothetical protein
VVAESCSARSYKGAVELAQRDAWLVRWRSGDMVYLLDVHASFYF